VACHTAAARPSTDIATRRLICAGDRETNGRTYGQTASLKATFH